MQNLQRPVIAPADDSYSLRASADETPSRPSMTDGGETAEPSSRGDDTVSDRPPAAASDLPAWEPLTPELVEDEALRGDFVLRWAVVLLAFLLAFTKIAETATLVHVKSGQYLAGHGVLPPAGDVFSYTAADRPWINLSWLFDLTAAGLFAVGGAGALTFLKALMAALTFGLIVHINRTNVSTWWGAICAALALLVAHAQFTAQPQMVTLLGVGLSLWLLHRWRTTAVPHDDSSVSASVGRIFNPSVPNVSMSGGTDGRISNPSYYGLPVLFLVWGNLDPRMYLGLAVVLLYAVGETAGHWLGRPALADPSRRRQLWLTVGACFVAALVNPFGWHALAAPLVKYGIEYPALRTWQPADWQHLWMFQAEFWQTWNPHTVAGLFLAAAALVSLVLNRKRLDGGHAALFAGFVGLAAAGAGELAPAALVFAVLATLNAQQWYQDHFRQSYSVELSERLFSGGGRAATVLALVAFAFLAVVGRLDPAGQRRIGAGFHPDLQANIDSLRELLADTYDDRPFNFRPEQGDVLIWLDRQVFVDSRVALYAKPFRGENLLALHDQTRHALRLPGDQRETAGRRDLWRKTFDRFEVTHVLPRLSGPNPDYLTYIDLLVSPDWQLTGLEAAAAVFHRADLNDRQLAGYLAGRRVEFIDLAFREPAAEPKPRLDWASWPSLYQRYLTPPAPAVPNAVQQALHYHMHLDLTGDPLQRVALAHLTIRQANEGLAEDPDCATAYRLLGSTYQFLAGLEEQIARSGGGSVSSTRRFYQAVQAYGQALLIEPDHAPTLMRLTDLYAGRQKLDLALRTLDRYQPLATDRPAEQVRRHAGFRQWLGESVDHVLDETDSLLENETDRLTAARFAYQRGCVSKALDVLDSDPTLTAAHPQALLLQGMLLMEAGRPREASEALLRLEGIAQQHAGLPWRSPAALVALANGDYARTIELWTDERQALHSEQTALLLQTLPLAGPSRTWPLSHLQLAVNHLYQVPEQTADLHFNIALSHLEGGQPDEAEAALRQTLAAHPETPLRPLVRFYLYEVAGELIDLQPPSDWIPITPDMFAEERQ